jgi:predicted ATPase
MSEFVRQAMHDHDYLITLSGGCNTYTGIGDPYLPFMEIIGQLAGDFGGKTSGGVISPQYIHRLLAIFPSTSQILLDTGPDLINRMIPAKTLLERALISNYSDEAWQQKLDTMIERSKGEQVSTELRQLDLFEQFTKVLLSVSMRNPLILIVDDLQWADIGSISLLFHLERRILGSRVMIIGAYRSEEVALGQDGKQHPMEPVFHEFQRDFGEIVINLDQCDGKEFIAALLDSEPNQLSPAFRELLFHHTAGHPLFTIELLRSMQDSDELIRDDTGKWIAGKTVIWDRLPQRVEAVIAERVGSLPRELRHILEAASVEGNEFTAEVVASVLQVDEESLVRQLSEQLEHKHHLATATQFRRMGDQRISGYRFQNQRFQKYLYDSLDNIEQAYLHDAVA